MDELAKEALRTREAVIELWNQAPPAAQRYARPSLNLMGRAFLAGCSWHLKLRSAETVFTRLVEAEGGDNA